MTAEPQPFKEQYNAALVQHLAALIEAAYPSFDTSGFMAAVVPRLGALELKGRVRAIAEGLRAFLPPDYPDALDILLRILGPPLPVAAGMFNQGWHLMPIAQFIETYGLDAVDVSLAAMYQITQRHTAEFAIRPFLVQNAAYVLERLHGWATDDSPHVRRWLSEGTRPRLPWGIRLDAFIRDPTPTLALLERLKDDDSAYVRTSVANHLNDIAKDHPDLVLDVARRWYATGTPERRWIVRHGLRTLIKRGHPGALAILGVDANAAFRVESFVASPATLPVGGTLRLALTLISENGAPHDAIIDFVVHFVRARGTAPKVFKWAVRRIAPGESIILTKNVSFRPVTTRKLYPGLHTIVVQVNGRALAEAAFVLLPA